MVEFGEDNDPFDEDIVFDQTDLLGNQSGSSRQGDNPTYITVVPTFMMFLRTIALCAVFIGLGLCASVSQGPMIHLEVIIGLPTSQAFHVFTAHSVGMLLGGILGAILFEIYNRQFLIFVSVMWIAVSVIILPFTLLVSFWWTMVTLAAIGAGLSFTFTGSNVLCLDLWGKQGGAYLQALHFSFALGAFIAPTVIHPFLMAPSNFGLQNFDNSSFDPDTEVVRVSRDLYIKTNLTEDTTVSPSFPPVVDLSRINDTTLAVGETQLNQSKAIKPKPSFTNANLIQEPNKWDKSKMDLANPDDVKTGSAMSKQVLKSTTPLPPALSTEGSKQSKDISVIPMTSPAEKSIPVIVTTEPITAQMVTNDDVKIKYVEDKDFSQAVDKLTENHEKSSTPSTPEVLGSQEDPSAEASRTVESTPHSTHQLKPGTFSNESDSNDARIFHNLMQSYKKYGITEVHLAFISIGIYLVMNSFFSVIFLCLNPREPRSKQLDNVSGTFLRNKMNIFTIIFALYMFSAEALQGAVHHLLASTHTPNGLPLVSRSIDGQAIFWGLICAVRFLCIIITGCFKIKSGRILIGSTFLLMLGTLLLTIGTFGKYDFLLAGIVVVALGLAPILPSCFLWMAQSMRVTHRMCALMIIISSFGNSITHTSLTFIAANSHLYSFIMVALSLCSVVFLTLSFLLIRYFKTTGQSPQPIGYQLANQLDDEEGLEMSPALRDYGDGSSAQRCSESGDARQALLID